MRGKLQKNEYGDDILGITPADAGKTVYPAVSARYRWDHPRGCGENFAGVVTRTLPAGITPADAGKTSRHTTLRCLARDHPRGCGENEGEEYKKMQAAGSPPRMRGKQAVTCRYGS